MIPEGFDSGSKTGAPASPDEAEPVSFSSEGLEIRGVLRPAAGMPDRAVVFCHGAFEFQDNWSAYAGRLSRAGFTTFTFDFSGHGASAGLRSRVDLRAWAYNLRDGLNFLDARGYRRFALVGWGSGGSAVLLAAAHDRRLACAVVMAAPVLLVPSIGERVAFGLVSLAARLKRLVSPKPLTLSRLNELADLRWFTDEVRNAEYFSDPKVRAVYRAVPVPGSLDSVWMDITQAIPKIEIPVLVVHGTEDEIVPIAQAQKLYDLLGGPKKLRRLEGGGHALHLDHTQDTVYAWIAGWVTKYL